MVDPRRDFPVCGLIEGGPHDLLQGLGRHLDTGTQINWTD
jgi:hypothetical protein